MSMRKTMNLKNMIVGLSNAYFVYLSNVRFERLWDSVPL